VVNFADRSGNFCNHISLLSSQLKGSVMTPKFCRGRVRFHLKAWKICPTDSSGKEPLETMLRYKIIAYQAAICGSPLDRQ
jgi:hypothetical protein